MKKNETTLPVAAKSAQPEVFTKKSKLMKELREFAAGLKASAMSLVISSSAEREAAAEIRAKALDHVKRVDAEFLPAQKAAYNLYSLVMDGIKGMKADADTAKREIETRMNEWDKAEKIRIQKEQARIQKELDEAKAREQAKLERKAEKAEIKGDIAKAEELREQAETVQVFAPAGPVMPKSIETESGKTSGSEDFDVVIVDPRAVIRAITDGSIAIGTIATSSAFGGGYTEIKITAAALKAWGKKQVIGNALPLIPGCKVTPKFSYRTYGK
ncbi:MAG: hypothetical protein WC374_11500 [Phycisphaerae bacterium]|jgi:hypothetical protein